MQQNTRRNLKIVKNHTEIEHQQNYRLYVSVDVANTWRVMMYIISLC